MRCKGIALLDRYAGRGGHYNLQLRVAHRDYGLFRGKSGHFWLQTDTQAPQVANCHFMSAFGG